MNNRIIQSLWVGKELSTIENLSISSYLKNDHEFHLYVYDDLRVPDGAVLKDANEIIPQNEIFHNPYFRDSYANFANIFRYKLLFERGGYWTDTDIICLKHFDFNAEYVFASEKTEENSEEESIFGKTMVNNCLIKVPKGAKIMDSCYLESLRKTAKKFSWGDLGPKLLNEYVENFKLDKYVVPYYVFNPIHWWQWDDIIKDDLYTRIKLRLMLNKNIYAIHFWNRLWVKNKADKNASYNSKCLIEKLKQNYLEKNL